MWVNLPCNCLIVPSSSPIKQNKNSFLNLFFFFCTLFNDVWCKHSAEHFVGYAPGPKASNGVRLASIWSFGHPWLIRCTRIQLAFVLTCINLLYRGSFNLSIMAVTACACNRYRCIYDAIIIFYTFLVIIIEIIPHIV